ncbi:MAG TPA: GNAT family N-acetyltransferase [Ktedonobacterales bacterium]|nr:GNAT family N-acetyltransferase [Ktedonobacterales bacterium]
MIDAQDLTRRVVEQRLHRYTDIGPDLAPYGAARFKFDGMRLRVAFASAQAGMASEVITRVLRFARRRGMQTQWTVMPQRLGEGEFIEALPHAGFALNEALLLMAHQGVIREPLNPQVRVLPVRSWDEMWAYEYGSRRSFFDDRYPQDVVVRQRARERWREQEQGWCRYYVAALDNRLVGGAYVTLFEEVPTIMGVYTVEEARHRGVATALLERVIGEIIRPENETCCLFVKHGNPAELLYRRLGFMPLVDELTYQREAGY